MASLGKRGADWARKNELSIAYGWLGKAGLLCMCCSVNGDSINSSHQGMKHILLDILSLESNEVLIMSVKCKSCGKGVQRHHKFCRHCWTTYPAEVANRRLDGSRVSLSDSSWAWKRRRARNMPIYGFLLVIGIIVYFLCKHLNENDLW
jgi:hypothetical protein